jgi:hypothetical protein
VLAGHQTERSEVLRPPQTSSHDEEVDGTHSLDGGPQGGKEQIVAFARCRSSDRDEQRFDAAQSEPPSDLAPFVRIQPPRWPELEVVGKIATAVERKSADSAPMLEAGLGVEEVQRGALPPKSGIEVVMGALTATRAFVSKAAAPVVEDQVAGPKRDDAGGRWRPR